MHKAELYTNHNSEQSAGIDYFLNNYGNILRSKFGNDKVKIIDIGSGCGRVLSKVLVPKSGLNFSKVIGIDISAEMIKFSNQMYGSETHSFYFMDAGGKIPEVLKNVQFDMATAIYSLMWIKNIKEAFMNVNELLRPGGYFCCVHLESHIIHDIWDLLAEKYPNYMGKWRNRFGPLWSIDDQNTKIRKCLNDCGFKIVKFLDGKDNSFDYKSAENFKSEYHEA